jgi:drug/metabolite transporter (DMT)-like permease
MTRPHRLGARDSALLLAVNLLWGSTYVVARGVLDSAPPLVLAFTRFLVASGWMLLWGSHRRKDTGEEGESAPAPTRKAGKEDAWVLAMIGVVGFGLAKLLNYEGLARSTATDAALIVNLEAVFTAAFAALLLGQRLGPAAWAGILVALGGGVALIWPSEPPGSAPGDAQTAWARALGNSLMVGSVAAEALASVLGVRAMRRYSGLQVTAYGAYWGTLCLFPLALWQWRAQGFSVGWLTGSNAAAILYLALGATVLAYALWYRVLARVDAGRAAAFLYTQPLIGVGLGVLVRHERPTWLGMAGGVLVLLGIALTNRPVREQSG